jgi:uncharacterized cupredoxin-like copper-binding protein
MKLTSLTVAILFGGSAAMAAGTHDGGHGHDDGHMAGQGHADMMQVGEMLFEPGELNFQPGETVRFRIHNAGEVEHEFVMDTLENNEEHRKLMQRFPEMEHDDPNAIRLAPGEAGEIVWSFANAGKFQFACLIPGHMEAGMHGPIHVQGN